MKRVLVINAGSSSVKYQLLDADSGLVAASGLIERIGEGTGELRHTAGESTQRWSAPIADPAAAFVALGEAFGTYGPDLGAEPLFAVGHRVVHGGTKFREATRIDEHVLHALEELTPLAPLHNPANIAGIRAALARFPDVPHVAVFDTAFHRTLPPAAFTYAVPQTWRDEHSVRRYGFHGTSHEYVSRRVSAIMGRSELAIVVLHLGNGCSACAVLDGESIDTSMGMTPLEGLVMGTRCGDLDPAIPFHMARTAGLGVAELDDALNKQSGLKGLAGANDYRTISDRAQAGDADAAAAIAVVVHRLVKYIGAYAAAMGRLDAIAFTGGIGEHSPRLRAAVLGRLTVFGVEIDADANAAAEGETLVTTSASRVAAYVIPTNEELQIARECRSLLQQ
ncbi:acetate kinase [Nostocoides vanveenii]|uniref:Acetate kinase n=1 Tax=Nostocoides vanveenii TaxID=330835 RepID=A0ABP4XGY1_9MICO